MGADVIVVPLQTLLSTEQDIAFERLGRVSQALAQFSPDCLADQPSKNPTHSSLPNTADLCFAKNVVRISREMGIHRLKQTDALNRLAQSVGQKSFSALLNHAPSVIQSTREREDSLVPTAIWVLESLVGSKLEWAWLLEQVVTQAARIPVFQYVYQNIPGMRAREHRIYTAGFLADIGPSGAYAHNLEDLGLLAVDYTVKEPQLLSSCTKESFLQLSDAARNAHYQCAYLRNPTLELADSATAQFEVVNEYLEKGFTYWMHSPHLTAVYGTDALMIGLPDYGVSNELSICTHKVSKNGGVHYFTSAPSEEDCLGQPYDKEVLREETGLAQSHIRRLSGGQDQLATYVLRMPSTLCETLFVIGVNVKGQYATQEEFEDAVSKLRAVAKDRGCMAYRSDICAILLQEIASVV